MRLRAFLVTLAVLTSGCGRECSSGRAEFYVDCESLHLDDAGTRRMNVFTGSGAANVTGACTTSRDGAAVHFDVGINVCGPGFGNNPQYTTIELECALPELEAGTYSLADDVTLTIPDDGGVGTCAR